jgi:hypothetical protein
VSLGLDDVLDSCVAEGLFQALPHFGRKRRTVSAVRSVANK